MKITKQQLIRLIKEELSGLFSKEDEEQAKRSGVDPLFVDKSTGSVRQMHLSPLEKQKALQAKQRQALRKKASAMRVDEQPEQMKLGKDVAKAPQTVAAGANKQGQQASGAAPDLPGTDKEADERLSKMNLGRLGIAESVKLKEMIRKLIKEVVTEDAVEDYNSLEEEKQDEYILQRQLNAAKASGNQEQIKKLTAMLAKAQGLPQGMPAIPSQARKQHIGNKVGIAERKRTK